MSLGNSSIPVTEHFWSLVDKADRKFARVRDVPLFGRNRNDADFQKAFRIYTQLWKLQQEHRQKLVDAGLRRWEIGEIATRIAQLYYSQYQRTSDSSYLAEAYIFYEAVFSREYFQDQGTVAGVGAQQQQESALANKQLRFLARFLIVCLILGRRDMVSRLVAQLRALVEESRKIFQETDFKEWKHIVQEIVRFLKYDTTFMNMRPLRYSFVFDAHPNTLPAVASDYKRRGLVLHDAILSSYWHNEVKFAELTLDTFRMLQSLEWEPSGQFATRSSAETGHNGACNNNIKILQDIRDATLPPNPRKLIMYRPSVTHFLTALATICEELPPDGIILLYLSAKGGFAPNNLVSLNSEISMRAADKVAGAFTTLEISLPVSSSSNSAEILLENKENDGCGVADQACLWLGSRRSRGSNCIYPCDLIPFTRRPLFLVIDSNQSHAFKVVHGAEKGEVSAILLSPIALPPTALDSACNGSQFTVFLTAPVQAFCMLVNRSGLNIDRDMFNEAEKLLSLSFSTVERTLLTSDSLHPIWIEALGDPLLRRLLLRFIFCRTVLSLYAPTFDKKEFLPVCLPDLPEGVSSRTIAAQEAVLQLAKFFGVADSFVFLDGIVLPHPPAGSPAMVADVHLHSSASNICQNNETSE